MARIACTTGKSAMVIWDGVAARRAPGSESEDYDKLDGLGRMRWWRAGHGEMRFRLRRNWPKKLALMVGVLS